MSSPEPATSNYVVTAPPVAVPTAKSQEMVLVRRSEIQSIKRGVNRAFTDPVGSAFAWATAWLGVGVSAALSLAALLGTDGNDVVPGVIAAHGSAVVIGFFLAAFLFWIARQTKGAREKERDDCLAELDELDSRAPSKVTEEVVN